MYAWETATAIMILFSKRALNLLITNKSTMPLTFPKIREVETANLTPPLDIHNTLDKASSYPSDPAVPQSNNDLHYIPKTWRSQ